MTSDNMTVQVDWLARRLAQQQEDAAATNHRVSRVPGHLRLANRDAYTPGLVARSTPATLSGSSSRGTCSHEAPALLPCRREGPRHERCPSQRGRRVPHPAPAPRDGHRVQDSTVVCTALLLRRLPLLLLYPIVASNGREDLPSANDLKRIGARFKRFHSGDRPAGIASVLGPVPLAMKLEYEDRVRLPRLCIEFRTAPLLLNLVAFEQLMAKPF
jgi:hypothetical protein